MRTKISRYKRSCRYSKIPSVYKESCYACAQQKNVTRRYNIIPSVYKESVTCMRTPDLSVFAESQNVRTRRYVFGC